MLCLWVAFLDQGTSTILACELPEILQEHNLLVAQVIIRILATV